jgi:hypothetical protein
MKGSKISLWPLFCAGLLVLLGGCGAGFPGQAQRNRAGTRSVALAAVPREVPEQPAIPADTTEPAILPAEAFAPEVRRVPGTEAPGLSGELVEIREKLFIAQTNDVYQNPEDYMGKLIRLEGLFKSQSYEDASTSYCFVLRYGPGCCGNDGSAGVEVAWDSAPAEDYPNIDDWVEAVGVLETYEEDGYPYLYLSLVSLTVKDERGAEFVAQ